MEAVLLYSGGGSTSRLHPSSWLQKPFSLGVTGVSVLRDSAELPLRVCTLADRTEAAAEDTYPSPGAVFCGARNPHQSDGNHHLVL